MCICWCIVNAIQFELIKNAKKGMCDIAWVLILFGWDNEMGELQDEYACFVSF